MPGTLIGNLFVDLVARTAQFQAGMAQARSTLRVVGARMQKFLPSSLIKILLSILIMFIAVRYIAGFFLG